MNKFLNQHPHLQSAYYKEVNFFSSDINFRNGLSWYEKQFPEFLEKKLFYESTPEYLYYPFVPERIKAFNPYIKMIVLLREPVERAYSAWNMFKKIYKGNKEVVIEKYFSLTNPDIRIAMTDFLNSPYYKSFEE